MKAIRYLNVFILFMITVLSGCNDGAGGNSQTPSATNQALSDSVCEDDQIDFAQYRFPSSDAVMLYEESGEQYGVVYNISDNTITGYLKNLTTSSDATEFSYTLSGTSTQSISSFPNSVDRCIEESSSIQLLESYTTSTGIEYSDVLKMEDGSYTVYRAKGIGLIERKYETYYSTSSRSLVSYRYTDTDNFSSTDSDNSSYYSSYSSDDHGDYTYSATSISADSTTSGYISSGDNDYFKITLTTSGTLTLSTTSSMDTYGVLYNSSGTQIAYNDESGSGSNFQIEKELDAGTYYVKVKGYYSTTTGSYTLNSSFEADSDDHGDYTYTATSISSDSTTSGYISSSDDDYFKITLTSSGTLTLTTTSSINTYGTLYNSYGTQIASNYSSGSGSNFKIEKELDAGTYYLKVEGYYSTTTGSYTLNSSFEAENSYSFEYTTVSANSSTYGYISSSDEQDIYRVDVSSYGTLTVSTTSSFDTVGYLYDSSQSQLTSNDDSGSGSNFEFSYSVSPGTYFIAVSGYSGATGSYTLNVSLD